MFEISSTEIAVLGLLYEHHHYAHRVEEIMNKRSMTLWADIEYSSIEDVLEKLLNNGLIKRKIKDKNHDYVYFITDKGKTVFLDEIKKLMSTRGKTVFPVDLAIANMYFLNEDEIIESLNKYLKSLEERIEFIDGSIKMQEDSGIPFNFIAIFTHSSMILKAEKQWIEEIIDKIKSK